MWFRCGHKRVWTEQKEGQACRCLDRTGHFVEAIWRRSGPRVHCDFGNIYNVSPSSLTLSIHSYSIVSVFVPRFEIQDKKEPEEEVFMDNDSNPVGKLQEICMKRRWRPPNYETVEEIGLPHERLFTMVCHIEHTEINVRVKGTGRSKKQAKRSAAHEMIIKLESMNIHHTVTPKTQVSCVTLLILSCI